MNNLFIEGPIQTGKSTMIRKVLRERFGSSLDGVAGFTSQRLTDPDGRLLGFRLAPADAELSAAIDPACLPSEGIPSEPSDIFKWFASSGTRVGDGVGAHKGTRVDMRVFETAGIRYMDEALAAAKAGRAKVILLDEIGGHELASDAFRRKLYELLDSEFPCVGVVKSPDNTRRMDPALVQLNAELHEHLTVTTDFAKAFARGK